MATASQCTVYAAYSARPTTITYSSFRPFLFLEVANAMAAFLEVIAIFLSLRKKGKDKAARVPTLLYSATGAAFMASDNLNYCSTYGKHVSVCAVSAVGGSINFCRVHIAIYLSLAAATACPHRPAGAQVSVCYKFKCFAYL